MTLRDLHRERETVRLNGERYVRYSWGQVAAMVLVHEQGVDVIAELDGAVAAAKAPEAAWETIWTSGTTHTHRLRVPGGWLVRHASAEGQAMAYVPDVKATWKTKVEQSR